MDYILIYFGNPVIINVQKISLLIIWLKNNRYGQYGTSVLYIFQAHFISFRILIFDYLTEIYNE